MRMSSGMSTPVSLVGTSTPLSVPGSFDELLELDKLDQVHHGDDDLQSRLELAERVNEAALCDLRETQQKLESLGAKHEELFGANKALTQWRDDIERQREEWATENARFAKRHAEIQVEKQEIEAKHSATVQELQDVSERHSEAMEEIARLKDRINTPSSSDTASPGTLDSEQDSDAIKSSQLDGYDQCLALLVQGSVFRVSRRLLARDSRYFEELLETAQATGDVRIGTTDAHPIVLDGVTAEEMNDFLGILYSSPFQMNFDHIGSRQWTTVLRLTTLWSFTTMRAYAIAVFDTKIAEEDPFNRLERAFAYAVPKWVQPAYDAICRRPESLSADEGRRLGWERYAAICHIREDLARGTLDVPVGDYSHLMEFSEDSPALGSTKDEILQCPKRGAFCASEDDEREQDAELAAGRADKFEASINSAEVKVGAEAEVEAAIKDESIGDDHLSRVQAEKEQCIPVERVDETQGMDSERGLANAIATELVINGAGVGAGVRPSFVSVSGTPLETPGGTSTHTAGDQALAAGGLRRKIEAEVRAEIKAEEKRAQEAKVARKAANTATAKAKAQRKQADAAARKAAANHTVM